MAIDAANPHPLVGGVQCLFQTRVNGEGRGRTGIPRKSQINMRFFFVSVSY